jgi:F-type H+-transporting ATPase subunit delta
LSENNITFSTKNSYSKALFELASENNLIFDVENQVFSILELISKSTDFKDLIKDPTNKIEDQLKKFLGFIVSKRRFFYIEKILNDFLTICSNARGEIQAELSVVKNLNESEINNIKDELSITFGSNIKLNHKYDSSLIGGLILKVGSTMIDTSIKNKLQQIEKKMIEV